jgi:hypothetical protein
MDRTLHDQKQHHRQSDKILREYTDLTAADIALLTQILSHAPRQGHSISKESYKLIVREQISKLPSYMRAKIPWVSSFCSLHSKINPFPVNSILEWLKDEVDRCVPEVWSPLRRQKLLDEEQMAMLATLENWSVLWNASDQSKQQNGRMSKMSFSNRRGSTRCSACILAQIGGNEQVLTALGAFFIGRIHSSIWKRSKRILWVESWVRGAVDDSMEDEAIRKMWRFGVELRDVRKRAPASDRAYVDEFVEKAKGTERPCERPMDQVGTTEPSVNDDRVVDDWLTQATADEVVDDEGIWQQLRPSQAGEPESSFEQEAEAAFEFEEDLEASQLFRVPSSVYSQPSEWSLPSSHDTESELIGLYQHSTLSLAKAREPARVRDSDGQHGVKGKQAGLAKHP